MSGRGSNLRALIDRSKQNGSKYEVALVLSDKVDPPAFQIAAEAGIVACTINHTDRKMFAAIAEPYLIEEGIELVALAGFMQILDAGFVRRWNNKIINIHPSVLPDYPGLHPHRRAIEDGAKFSGCTVHYVIPEIDAGPIIGQCSISLNKDETEDTLAARILKIEHEFYPICMDYVANKILEEGNQNETSHLRSA